MGDWTSLTYIFSQVFVIIAYCFLASTYFIRKRQILLVFVIISNITLGIGFALLSAWVGLGMCGVAICRDIVSHFTDRKRKNEDKNKITKLDCVMLAIWATLLITITAFTSNGFLSWFAFFATMSFTISIWQKNIFVYKLLGVLVCIFWIIYNFAVESLFGVILESTLLIAVVIGLLLYIIKSHKQRKFKSIQQNQS